MWVSRYITGKMINKIKYPKFFSMMIWLFEIILIWKRTLIVKLIFFCTWFCIYYFIIMQPFYDKSIFYLLLKMSCFTFRKIFLPFKTFRLYFICNLKNRRYQALIFEYYDVKNKPWIELRGHRWYQGHHYSYH